MNIFVARLDYNTGEHALQDAFEAYGDVDSAKIIMDKQTGRSKGFGFVEMPNDDEALDAIDDLNDTDMDGRTIVVKKANARENNRNNNGGNRRSNYNNIY